MEPLDPDAFEPNAGDPNAGEADQPFHPLSPGHSPQAQDNGGGVGEVLSGAADLASPVINGVGLASDAIGAAGEIVTGGAEIVGEVASGALEGIGAVAEGCGSCSLAVLVMLFATVGTAFAIVR